ncbi:similar to Saccharomyces cerevisiae YML020W Putative protein of unknown function [Maudiozyma saulgeensis]|uniref:YMC020W-like alpha/beta hydrolase domain-containing protein n=1 Tax=Maudiozyma saulgeensis TaxID=1789683 RepID=A0A1X7QX83_9SACH|nr:similar to Saccharomyces cerevisiae YML020W Putative protein of unknown function [Kazachstania saulgeensis]
MAQDKAITNIPISDGSENNTRPSTGNKLDNNETNINQEDIQVTLPNEANKTLTREQEPHDSKDNDHIETTASSSSTSHKRTWSFWSSYKSDDNKPTSAPNNNNIDKNLTPAISQERQNITQNPQMPLSEGIQGPAAPKYGNPLANTYIPYNADLNEYSKSNILPTSSIDNSGQDEQEQEPNIVVPGFDILPKKSLWNSIHDMMGSRNSNPQKYVYRVDASSKLNKITHCNQRPLKVLIVGVHGFFPLKVLRTFIGEPTGTSMKFITEAEEIVKKYFKNKRIPIEISKISLEKEGEIFDRVDFFFDVMRRYSKEINNSDFIYFVSHSQGCPVTIILLARLIETGIINIDNSKLFNNQNSNLDDINLFGNKKIISILGMAGINNGPFYGRDQTLLVKAYQTIAKDAMMELFELQKFDTIQTKKLVQSIKIIIANNVKLTLVGSINDQLVPLYSAFCLFVDHPYIFRATFIDRNSRTPSFITRIIKVAGTLLNLGYRDHDIVKEISGSLVGPLTGGGHSTIYNEKQVYELGLKFALETTDTNGEVPVIYTPYKLSELGSNPYHLPWCMRGLLFETKRHMDNDEINTLYLEYEQWKPESKQLKDIRYRLNGLQYKL